MRGGKGRGASGAGDGAALVPKRTNAWPHTPPHTPAPCPLPTSCAMPWLMRCARKRAAAVHTGLSLRLYERMNCRHSLRTVSPGGGVHVRDHAALQSQCALVSCSLHRAQAQPAWAPFRGGPPEQQVSPTQAICFREHTSRPPQSAAHTQPAPGPHLCSSSSPSSGNLVFTTATSAEYTGEKEGEASCDFMSERQNRPRPRTRFCAGGGVRDMQWWWCSLEK